MSVGQGCGSSSAEWFWLSVSHEVRVQLSGRAAVIPGLDRGWRNHFQGGALTWWTPTLAVGWRPQASPRGLLHGCLSVLTTWRLASSASNPSKSKEEAAIFFMTVSEVTHHFCSALLVTQCGRKVYNSVNTRRPSWRLLPWGPS